MTRKIAMIVCILCIAAALFGCSAKNEYASKTLIVKITEINGSKYTGLIGELSQNNTDMLGGMKPPEMPMPTGEVPMPAPTGEMYEGVKPPEMPMPTGEVHGGMNKAPALGHHVKPFDENMPMPTGEAEHPETGGMPFFSMGGINQSSFVPTEGSVTFEIDDTAVIVMADGSGASISDITVESVVTVTFDDKGRVSAVTVNE